MPNTPGKEKKRHLRFARNFDVFDGKNKLYRRFQRLVKRPFDLVNYNACACGAER